MKRVEVRPRLPDIPGTAHDGEPEQAAPRRQRFADQRGRRPEQHGREGEAIAQKLGSREPETVGELAEDAQRAETDGRADDKRDPGRVSVGDGRRHPAVPGMRGYWTMTGE